MTAFKPNKKTIINDKVVISLRLAKEKLDRIDKLSIETDISRNELLNQCIDFALKNIQPSKKSCHRKTQL